MTEADHDREYEAMASPLPRVIVTSLRDDPNYVKCPRCWHYHTVKENHDCLCDRCSKVMVENWPDHPATPAIVANLEAQRAKYTVSTKETHDH
jgi:hypothetical protein